MLIFFVDLSLRTKLLRGVCCVGGWVGEGGDAGTVLATLSLLSSHMAARNVTCRLLIGHITLIVVLIVTGYN